MTTAAEQRPVLPMGELSDYAGGPALMRAETASDRLTLTWESGEQSAFSLTWLRDHCPCPECRHAKTRERLTIPLEPPERAPGAQLMEGNLELVWADDHQSRFDAGWLHQRRPGQTPGDTIPARRPWAEGFQPVSVDHADFTGSAEGERAWLDALLRDGLVLLDNGPLADEEVSRLAERIGPLRPTNFGARFDVRSKPNPNNAAYTAIGLAPHTDLPNWRQPPDIQLLYCLENGADGGESTFSDGFAAATALRERSPEAFRLLSETPIDFRFQDDHHDIAWRAPILTLGADGELLEVRFNNWIRDTLHLPPEQADAWYRAYREFWHLVHEPNQQLEFSLAPGQMVAFDNRRMLHGRKAFNPESGRRHLQGTYLDLDLLESRLRVLARRA
ncbi:TauD/TfdA family dioxygenase [Halomonas garicola]|uniref:TauD/TfdA family dioxygenase n=1 Tax=Halomonas garicola TaxID=1690008 RepID=UPI002899615C|nr:TauD/TfdA family dioxygenase [Halomonas garicola]